jgi:uncharacterized protein (DUF1778 family)
MVAHRPTPAWNRVPVIDALQHVAGTARTARRSGPSLAALLIHTAKCRILGEMKQDTQPTARLEARLPNEVMARLKRAAEIQGRTLTDFVVAAADEAACRAIEQTEIIRLSLQDQRQIAEAILNPPEPTPALRKAFQSYRELFGAE